MINLNPGRQYFLNTPENIEPMVPVSDIEENTDTTEVTNVEPTAPSTQKYVLYLTKETDTLTSIAIMYGVTVEELEEDNPGGIRMGQEIRIRVK